MDGKNICRYGGMQVIVNGKWSTTGKDHGEIMTSKMLYCKKLQEEDTERGSSTYDPYQRLRDKRRRSSVRFLTTGSFGELEHRQELRAITWVLRG